MHKSKKQQSAEQNMRKEAAIGFVSAVVSMATNIIFLIIAVIIFSQDQQFIAVLILIGTFVLSKSNKTIGSSRILVRWYDTIIEQEKAKYLRYGRYQETNKTSK